MPLFFILQGPMVERLVKLLLYQPFKRCVPIGKDR